MSASAVTPYSTSFVRNGSSENDGAIEEVSFSEVFEDVEIGEDLPDTTVRLNVFVKEKISELRRKAFETLKRQTTDRGYLQKHVLRMRGMSLGFWCRSYWAR